MSFLYKIYKSDKINSQARYKNKLLLGVKNIEKELRNFILIAKIQNYPSSQFFHFYK